MVIETKVAIFGGGLSGLVAAYTLARNGTKPILIERSPRLAGGNRSYRDSKGRIFDSGHHALDYNRSKSTTNLFIDALDDRYHRLALRRGIVLGGEVFDYGLPPEKWPESLQPLLRDVFPRDNIEGSVTRDKITRDYGKVFADFIYDSVLASYPTLIKAIEEGGAESDQMRLIYPWYFPSIPKGGRLRTGESESYHDAMRGNGQKQEILYPKEGGFENFPLSLARKAENAGCRILLGESHSEIVFREGGKKIEKIKTGEGDVVAEKYLWCAPVPLALHILGKSLGLKSPQNLVLGNFSFENELSGSYHEILIGDKSHLINRITYPGRLSQSVDKTLQVEFLCPRDKKFDKPLPEWRNLWEASLRELALITENNKIEEFSFHCEGRGFVVPEKYDDLIVRCRKMYDECDTNLEIPCFSLGPENINRLVPDIISYIEREVL